MERRAVGPRGLPQTDTGSPRSKCTRIPFLWARTESVRGLSVRAARREDLDEMGALWRVVAPAPAARTGARRGATRRIHRRCARSGDRGLPGRASCRRSHRGVPRALGSAAASSSCACSATRAGCPSRAPRSTRSRQSPGTPRLPGAGSVLPSLAALHLCVPDTRPRCFARCSCTHTRSIVGQVGCFLTLALDRRDPLRTALRGLFAQPTHVGAYVTTPGGSMAWASARRPAAALRVGARMNRDMSTRLDVSLAAGVVHRRRWIAGAWASSPCCCSRTRAKQPRGWRLPRA